MLAVCCSFFNSSEKNILRSCIQASVLEDLMSELLGPKGIEKKINRPMAVVYSEYTNRKIWLIRTGIMHLCNIYSIKNKLGQRQSQTPFSSAFWVQKFFWSKQKF